MKFTNESKYTLGINSKSAKIALPMIMAAIIGAFGILKHSDTFLQLHSEKETEFSQESKDGSSQLNHNFKINGDPTVIVLSQNSITLNGERYDITENAAINSLTVQSLPGEKMVFSGVRSELKDESDPRIIDDYLSYADRREQVPQVRNWLSNPYSGYSRLMELYRDFFSRYRNRIEFSGNRVPLTALNAHLLNVLGRDTAEPLRPDESVSDADLLTAYMRGWYEKNSN